MLRRRDYHYSVQDSFWDGRLRQPFQKPTQWPSWSHVGASQNKGPGGALRIYGGSTGIVRVPYAAFCRPQWGNAHVPNVQAPRKLKKVLKQGRRNVEGYWRRVLIAVVDSEDLMGKTNYQQAAIEYPLEPCVPCCVLRSQKSQNTTKLWAHWRMTNELWRSHG